MIIFPQDVTTCTKSKFIEFAMKKWIICNTKIIILFQLNINNYVYG